MEFIEVIGAKQHNLKDIDVKFPKRCLSVVTGPSGSGKSSLAFSTLFAEGQRRYIESLSTYARQFLDKHEKPDVTDIKHLSPTIAIEQKNHTKNSRSTVGTATEIYDYLRLFFAKAGKMYSPKTGKLIKKDVIAEIVSDLERHNDGKKTLVYFPVDIAQSSKIKERKLLLASFMEAGFSKVSVLEKEANKKAKSELFDIQECLSLKTSPIFGKSGKSHQFHILIDRFVIEKSGNGRLEESLAEAYRQGMGRAHIVILDDKGKSIESYLQFHEFPNAGDDLNRYPELTPLLFSFNSPMGACQSCNGFGHTLEIDPKLVIPNENLSISQGAIDPLSKPSAKNWLRELVLFCQKQKISLHLPWKDLSKEQKDMIWDGDDDEFKGINGFFNRLDDKKYKMQVRVFLSRYRSSETCSECKGERLRVEARHVLIQKKNIAQLCNMSLDELSSWLEKTKFTKTEIAITKDILPQIKSRIDFLLRVGLHYLTLSRLAKTLSGGEAQRIALANQLGSRLTQTCYVLDEPSIGLHPADTEKLIGILKELAELRNTVVVVEHDADVIAEADYLVDIGPHAGENGGKLLYQGEYKKFLNSTVKDSSTWSFMSGKENFSVPRRRRLDRFKLKGKKVNWLTISDCEENNLNKVDVKIPLNTFCCVTGVSGSGKSSAIRKTLHPALCKRLLKAAPEAGKHGELEGVEHIKNAILINQDPIGRTPRSNPITFLKGFDEIRSLFAKSSQAKKRNFHQGFFSFNVPGGRCEHCEGEGYVKIEMQFMEDIYVLCEQCQGKRYKPDILQIELNGKNIYDVLQMTVTEAARFFRGNAKLQNVLGTLRRVGLGYLKLGQAATTLSGGESQRLKIARELMSGIHRNQIVYFLDEPTTGLHFRDVKILLKVLHELVEHGNTVVVVEHNLEVMKGADWVIDFGPGGGIHGGDISFEGTPEDLVKEKKNLTAKYLAPVLKDAPKVGFREFLGDSESAKL